MRDIVATLYNEHLITIMCCEILQFHIDNWIEADFIMETRAILLLFGDKNVGFEIYKGKWDERKTTRRVIEIGLNKLS